MRRGMRELERRTIIVHSAGPSIEGVLIRAHRDCLVLGAAKTLDPKADLKGEIRVPLTQGVWVQTP